MNVTEKREVFIESLRAAAEFYTEHPDFPVPYMEPALTAIALNADELTSLTRLLGGKRSKEHGDDLVTVERSFGWLRIKVIANRETVCERVQVGERTTTREVLPDDVQAQVDDLIASATTLEEVTEPIYEWECSPILEEAS